MSRLSIDDLFLEHPKVIGLTDRAVRVHLAGMLYASRYRTRGALPRPALPLLGATPKIVRELVAAGVWDETPDGLAVHDFQQYNAETISERVAAYLQQHPDASANEVHRVVGGKREIVIAEVARHRNGTPPVPETVPEEPQEPVPPEPGKPVPSTGTKSVPSARAREPEPGPSKANQTLFLSENGTREREADPDPEPDLDLKQPNGQPPNSTGLELKEMP